MAHGKYKVPRRQSVRGKRWQENRDAVREFFERKVAERVDAGPRVLVVGVKPPGGDRGPVR